MGGQSLGLSDEGSLNLLFSPKSMKLCVERERQVRQQSGKGSRHEQGLLTCQASDGP
jgi:hypothetical protein